jgi:hypothetical protein
MFASSSDRLQMVIQGGGTVIHHRWKGEWSRIKHFFD